MPSHAPNWLSRSTHRSCDWSSWSMSSLASNLFLCPSGLCPWDNCPRCKAYLLDLCTVYHSCTNSISRQDLWMLGSQLYVKLIIITWCRLPPQGPGDSHWHPICWEDVTSYEWSPPTDWDILKAQLTDSCSARATIDKANSTNGRMDNPILRSDDVRNELVLLYTSARYMATNYQTQYNIDSLDNDQKTKTAVIRFQFNPRSLQSI